MDKINEAKQKTALKSNGVFSVMNNTWIKEPIAADIPEIDKDAFDKEFKVWEDRYNKIIDSGEKVLKEDLSDAKSIIADQIRGEWEAIRNYEKAVDDLNNIDGDFDSVIKILNDIADEEEVHVGELTQAQTELDNNVLDNIEEGHEEAEEKMSETANDLDYEEAPVKESLTEEIKDPKVEEIDKFLEDIYELRKQSIATDGEYGIGNLVFKELRNKGYLDNLRDLKGELINKDLSLD